MRRSNQAAVALLSLVLLVACSPTEHIYFGDGGGLDGATEDLVDTGSAVEDVAAGTAKLCLAPTVLDFGMASTGGVQSRTLDLMNCGDLPISVHSATIEGPEFFVAETNPSLPLHVPVDANERFSLGFLSTKTGHFEAQLVLTWAPAGAGADDRETSRVEMSAEAVAAR